MNETVKLILSLSLSASILAILIFVLKPFIKHKVSKSIQYYLWLVVLLRLVIPFSFEGSIMNNVFYSNHIPMETTSPAVVQPVDAGTIESVTNTLITPEVQGSSENINNSGQADYGRYLKQLFNNYALYLWLLGVIIALSLNITGYIRFSKYLKEASKSATEEESKMLAALLNGRSNVRLKRNRFVTTPMLIGILRPSIIIPDANFNEKQLKNILLHEITHLRRFDIGVKWLTMIAASIHWFNPLMYLIKKEVNHACELSCDEAVIKNLTLEEKQAYGDTLISVVAEHKYPIGVLQATMCEEKKSLKERLVAIMNHSKKSKLIVVVSIVLLGVLISGAVYLGAGVGAKKEDTPPDIYISAEGEHTKTALRGGYSWIYKGKSIIADSSHPTEFKYKLDNTVSVSGNQQLVIGTQKLNKDKKYDFTLFEVSVYKEGKLIGYNWVEPSFMNGSLYIQAPTEAGEYIYSLTLNFKGRGTVNYRFAVRVDMPTYKLTQISNYKTPYIGDNSKVSAIVSLLPEPESYFRQQYTSMITDKKPYQLNVFYELKEGASPSSKWPLVLQENPTYYYLDKNALVLFCMIDNLDEVTFRFRNSQSKGKLEEAAYDSFITFTRASIKEKYGDVSAISKNLDLLQSTLTTNKTAVKTPVASANSFIELDKLPELYNSDEAIKSGDVVFLKSKIYNSSKLADFYTAFKERKADKPYMLRITMYTVEGDAVIHDLSINSQGVKLIVDNTRDKFSNLESTQKRDYKVSDIVKEEKSDGIAYTIISDNNMPIFIFLINDKLVEKAQ